MDPAKDVVGRPALREITANSDLSLSTPPAAKPSSKLGGATPIPAGNSNKSQIDFDLNESGAKFNENVLSSFNVKGTPERFGKSNLSSSFSNSPSALPDIVNVTPSTPGIENANPSIDISLISALTKDLEGALSLNSPATRVKSSLLLPNPSQNEGDASGLSSDDEMFAECQSFPSISLNATANVNDAEVFADNPLRLSATTSNWDNLVTSVITSSTENLDQTIEHIDHLDEDTPSPHEFGAADSTTSNTASANTTAEAANAEASNFESNADTDEILQMCSEAIQYEPELDNEAAAAFPVKPFSTASAFPSSPTSTNKSLSFIQPANRTTSGSPNPMNVFSARQDEPEPEPESQTVFPNSPVKQDSITEFPVEAAAAPSNRLSVPTASNLNSTFAASSEALNSTINLDKTFGGSEELKTSFGLSTTHPIADAANDVGLSTTRLMSDELANAPSTDVVLDQTAIVASQSESMQDESMRSFCMSTTRPISEAVVENANFEADEDEPMDVDESFRPQIECEQLIDNNPFQNEQVSGSNQVYKDISFQNEQMSASNPEGENISSQNASVGGFRPVYEDISFQNEQISASNPECEDISSQNAPVGGFKPVYDDISFQNDHISGSEQGYEVISSQNVSVEGSKAVNEDVSFQNEQISASKPGCEGISSQNASVGGFKPVYEDDSFQNEQISAFKQGFEAPIGGFRPVYEDISFQNDDISGSEQANDGISSENASVGGFKSVYEDVSFQNDDISGSGQGNDGVSFENASVGGFKPVYEDISFQNEQISESNQPSEEIPPPETEEEPPIQRETSFAATKAEKDLTNTERSDLEFKMPTALPGRRSMDVQEPTDEDFQSNGIILNPSDFDFLLTKGNTNVQVDRSSLLLRFDPLLGVAVPNNAPQATSQSQALFNPSVNTLTAALPSQLSVGRLSACQEEAVEEKDEEAVAVAVAVKNEVVTPVGSPELATPRSPPIQITTRSIKKNEKMSVDVIQDMNIENDVKSIDHLNSADEKHKFKMDELEKKIKNEVLKTEDIEKKLKDAEQREEALLKRITEKDKKMSKMNDVIEAYEKAIAELIAEKEQITQSYEQQLNDVKEDRDSNYRHLTSLETTFSDLHVKYEKSKELTAQLKASEEALQAEKKQNLENLRLQEQRYEKMKNHAMQQLEIANKKLESLTKNHNTETTKLKALLKKEEISRASINEQLHQKTRENEELVKICDELINGQGS